MADLSSIVEIRRGQRKDGKGEYVLVCVARNLQFSNLAYEIAKDAGCKEITVEPKSK